ncbi:MAG: hypothetical protein MMC33_006350 [Icmadophila ericetorum]|nr:hypothetical protein [Icmadophila ericetorum]
MNIFNSKPIWGDIFSSAFERTRTSTLLLLLLSYNVLAQTPFGFAPSTNAPPSIGFGDIDVEPGINRIPSNPQPIPPSRPPVMVVMIDPTVPQESHPLFPKAVYWLQTDLTYELIDLKNKN